MEDDLEITFAREVLEAMNKNPELAAAIREFCANMRQAKHAVLTGQHKTIEDAMEAITGHRPERLDTFLSDRSDE